MFVDYDSYIRVSSKIRIYKTSLHTLDKPKISCQGNTSYRRPNWEKFAAQLGSKNGLFAPSPVLSLFFPLHPLPVSE